MMILSLIFLAFIATGIYVWHKNRPLPSNRYRKIKHVAPIPVSKKTALKEEAETTFDSEEDDFDVLGIRSKEVKSTLSAQTTSSALKSASSQSDCVVVLYLMAPEGCVYAGYELLQALLSAGMRYGKKRIFNRHEHKDGRGAVLFHCASSVPPGTFDLAQMGSFSCKGLCLFFSCSDVEEPLSTFDSLLETIDQLVEDIGGQVFDEKRALFTKDRMVKYRQQIRTFETGKTTADLFA
ncbi:MAG: hypothetical protein A3F13_08430 [Gammaproteobacteria bacterium RIFCSPHIGHO2_12_FULL_40_19]|nr:MAG: hypothetical protein A3F13_08430 [Gammaproteobacteria bacterium RIFCSPHIGHO2_12_FULL_40_19]